MQKTVRKYPKTLIFLVCIALFLTATSFQKGGNEGQFKCLSQYISSVCSYKDLVFCDEPMPLQDPEVFERMDREMLVNSYWQSNTLLSLKLAKKYFPVIEPILKQYGVPDDFKYLAVIESGMRDVVSPSGAAGKWQIMKGTAQQFGLVVNEEIDERYHVEKATIAACKYLLTARNSLSSWTAVAASYNMGVAGISKKMNEQSEMDYYNLWLNQETARYVFRIVAMKEIYTHPNQFGYYYDDGDKYPEFKTEKVWLYLPNDDLVAFAKNRGSNYKTLRYLNPWIRDSKITTLKDSIQIIMPVMTAKPAMIAKDSSAKN